MEKVSNSYFQFKGFEVTESHFIMKKGKTPPKTFNLEFVPSGKLNKSKNEFLLELQTIITGENNAFKADIKTIALFTFQKDIEETEFNNYLYVNAPAILFPYIRAYITTLTTLSGINPVILPTLNLSVLGEELKKNTKEV